MEELIIKFYEEFKIPAGCLIGRTSCKQYGRSCDKCCNQGYLEPTDEQYLELIVVLNNFASTFDYTQEPTVESLKYSVLQSCIQTNQEFPSEAQAIFRLCVQRIFIKNTNSVKPVGVIDG